MQQSSPNILILMTDEQRCDSVGCYDNRWAQTPNLDALASQGTQFLQALTPAPVCGPARAAILTGKQVPQTGIWSNADFCDDQPFLTDHFVQAGYNTATFGKQHYCTKRQAFETEADFMFSDAVKPFNFSDPALENQYKVVHHPSEKRPWILASQFPEDETQIAEHKAVDAAMDWLEGQQEKNPASPFLLRVSLNAPHTPVCPPKPFDTCIDIDSIDLPKVCDAMPDNAPAWLRNILKPYAGTQDYTDALRQKIRQSYYGFASYADDQFGRLLEAMRSQGLLENTIVAFLSDHGTHLGDYGLIQKQSFYKVSVNVPYIITDMRHPRQQMQSINEPVSTLSLLPTLMQLAGLKVSDELGNLCLADTITKNKIPTQQPVFSALTFASSNLSNDRLILVQLGNWKLALNVDSQPVEGWLCNIADDSMELGNQFNDPSCQAIQSELTQLIFNFVA